ncbi:amidohydrolase family protein [Saccharopolyspora sp. ASAGF58]|uniref:amidohydrolase family protein n=1 Tax=Saccharopolyspora sp. ASAGF58 TaxID=2719023 RepID=UPI001B3127E2|nr:amidohydrolase family protein [Saccharopolyspora sp. ASAGF58]
MPMRASMRCATGIQAVFAHGWPYTDADCWLTNSTEPNPADLRQLREKIPGDDGLLTLAMGARGPSSTVPEVTTADFRMARELGIPITMHVSGNDYVALPDEAGLLRPDLTFVHVSSCGDHELAADHGVSISIASQIELTMPGLGLPTIERLLHAGLAPILSVDSELPQQVTCSRSCGSRSKRAPSPSGRKLSTREVMRWATSHGAAACGVADRTRSLTPGKEADVVLPRADDVNLSLLNASAEALVLAAHPGNVDTVLVAGRVVKRHGRLIGDVAQAGRLAAAASERLR